ncbi:DUF4236 domain-containing protein [Pantoea sp. DY-15]|nr:DUF4236 domain-containing protein [Pantoea sp. DY-15]
MELRFRKSIRILTGVKVNQSSSGANMSVAPRGGSLNAAPMPIWGFPARD